MTSRPFDPVSRARREANAQLALHALARGSGPAFHGPVEVYLQVASACNLDCYMCSEHNRPEHERFGRGLVSMAPEVFAEIERELLPRSIRTVFGIGGEPTLAPRFPEYVERAARADQEIHLVTNGTRFVREPIVAVVARHVAQIFVSLDAATPQTYERIRRGSRWDSTMAGILRLEKLLRARPDPGTLTLSFVLMRSNVHELPAFVDLAHGLGARRVHAQHVIPVTAEAQRESLFNEPESYERAYQAAARRARELGLEFDAPKPYAAQPQATDRGPRPSTAAPRPIPCSQPTTSIFVLYDGRVVPCCHPFAHAKMQIGDLRTQGAAAIWNGPLLRNLRAGLPRGDAPGICRSCSCVHDPPPAEEDAKAALAGPDAAAYYAGRDLEAQVALPHSALPHSALPHRQGATAVLGYLTDLRLHASTLERERAELQQHARTLEGERPHLRGHIANLERELADLRSRWTLRQRLVLRARRLAARLLSRPRALGDLVQESEA